MAKTEAVHVALTEAPEAAQGADLIRQAQGIVIRSKADQIAALEFQTGVKALKKKVIEHYAAIKGPLNLARNRVLDMEKRDLAPLDLAIDKAGQFITEYVREQERIEAAQAEENRRREEARIQAERDAEAAKAEAEALNLEASSNVLSEREQRVAEYVAARNVNDPNVWLAAVRLAAYKDAEKQASRLMALPKIGAAVENLIKARRLRAESEAKQAQPIVVETKPVESQIGKVAGTSVRRYYSCASVDLIVLMRAALEEHDAGRPQVLIEAIQPNMTHLNDAARRMPKLFEQVYKGCKLGQRDGVAG